MELLDTLKNEFKDYLAESCSEHGTGTRISLGRLKNSSAILKLEKDTKNSKKCDCLIILVDQEKIIIFSIELKSKSFSVTVVAKKIQKCLEFTQSKIFPSIKKLSKKIDLFFFPLLVYINFPSKQNLCLSDPQNRVCFNGQFKTIIKIKNKTNLETFLQNIFNK
ncbi:MAG: hypothetical protein ACTSQI_20050 [Candidatus Helarchaeota archaeon]